MESEVNGQIKATINSAINSCIQVEEARISRRATRPRQVHFYLDSDLIRQIEWVKENNYQLILSSSNLASLRYYALINVPLETIGLRYPWHAVNLSFVQRSSLTFATDYLFPNGKQPRTLFRSVIDLEGKISQQIHQDLSRNPQLLPRISQAHYWLILEILAQLPLKPKNQYLWLSLGLYSIILSTISLVIYYFCGLSFLLSIIICISIILIFNISLKRILIEQLKPLIIYHLIDGCLGKSVKVRQIGLQILNLII